MRLGVYCDGCALGEDIHRIGMKYKTFWRAHLLREPEWKEMLLYAADCSALTTFLSRLRISIYSTVYERSGLYDLHDLVTWST